MNGRKSIYYMTDSELRAYKRRKRRQQMLRNRIFSAVVTVCLVLAFAVGYYSIKSSANTGDEQVSFKYYTSVTVEQGDTLWSIADEFIDYNQYKSKAAYIAEVQSINHLDDTADIITGQALIVPYYSYEFVK